jgi:uncharacterized lipoprotein YddW (UPF0748 family)
MRLSQSMYLSVRMIVVIAVIAGSGCAIERNQPRADRTVDATLTDSVFGLWVTRWDYQTQGDIRTIVADAASMGITDLYWQVRGQGDAYYRSDLEPWGEELTRPRGEEGKSAQSRDRTLDPGFDPLALAIDEAHRQGVRVHAWINVMPLWRGKTPPIDQSHSFYTHPEWRLSDETGKPQPLGDGYVVVNPVLDSVQDHIVAVVGDIAERYNIDGIHLDYIRFLTDELGKEKLYPGDAQSLSLYARMVGDRATIGQLNRTKYRAWIRDRITTLVKRIGRESLDGHTEIRYSAAVWRRPDLAKDQYLQDAQRWVNEGMVDEIMPMIYTEKDTQFEDDLEAWYSVVDRKRVLAGIGVYKHPSAGQTLSQVTLGHPRRFVLFAYSSIFESSNPDQDKSPDAVRLRAMERDALTQFIRRIGG